MGTRPPMVMRMTVDDKIYGLGSRNVTYQDLGELPSKSAELRTYLERLYAADSGAETGAGRTAWVLRQAANLITMRVKPAVRAAAYRVMADLPGVKVLGRVSDPLGREGVGVVFPGTARTSLGITEQRLVVDPSTGAMLSEQQVLVEPSARAREAALDAGTTLNYQATSRMSWGGAPDHGAEERSPLSREPASAGSPLQRPAQSDHLTEQLSGEGITRPGRRGQLLQADRAQGLPHQVADRTTAEPGPPGKRPGAWLHTGPVRHRRLPFERGHPLRRTLRFTARCPCCLTPSPSPW
ncbi:CU044_5270 family protein [Streptomyces sp. NPDC005098]|uniref:CU044_5270 family protein n=1 Tax=Streptomyces sp. NPDC005098 TaxID=3154560 RepID=UPI0033A0129C